MVTKVLSLATPPEVLKLQVGNTCRVMVNYDYSGPQITAKIRVPIGRVGVFGFDEVVYEVVSITVPDTPEKTTYQTPVDVYISSAMTVQPGYDLYAKIVDIPGADIHSPTYHNVIEIEEPGPSVYHLEVHVPSWASGGYISPGSGNYPANKVLTLTANPLSGYRFISWGVDASGTSPTYNLLMDGDKYVEAYFQLIPGEFVCAECGASFDTYEGLIEHLMAVHGYPPPPG